MDVFFAKGMCSQTPYFPDATVLVVSRRNEDGQWTDGMCTASKPAEGAQADLDILRELRSLKGKGFLIGRTIGPWNNPLVSTPFEVQKRKFVSDKNGDFKIRLRSGSYEIGGEGQPAIIESGGCVYRDVSPLPKKTQP